jgi:hypothetical protein
MTSREFVKVMLGASIVGLLAGFVSSPSAGLVIGAALAVGAISILPRPETGEHGPVERREIVPGVAPERPRQRGVAADGGPLVPYRVGRPAVSGAGRRHEPRRAGPARARRVGRARRAQSPARRR